MTESSTKTKLHPGCGLAIAGDAAGSPGVTSAGFGVTKQPKKLEPLHPVQIQRFRQMTPVEKWNVALGLLGTARATRRAALRRGDPHLTEAEIEQALAKEFSCART